MAVFGSRDHTCYGVKRLSPKDTPKVKSTIPGGNVRSISREGNNGQLLVRI